MRDKTWDAATYDAHFGFVTELGAPLLELLAAQSGEKIIDVGCGTGHQAQALGEIGAVVLGIDADERMIDRARAESGANANVTFVRADAQDRRSLAVSEVCEVTPADAVLSNAALHWMTQADSVVANVRSLLRTGGRFVAEMGAARNVDLTCSAIESALTELGVSPAEIAVTMRGQWWFPTPATQAGILEAAGFDVASMQYFARRTPLKDGDTLATWSRMFATTARSLVPSDRVDELDSRIDAHGVRLGLDAGGWHIDYTRLRFVAIAG